MIKTILENYFPAIVVNGWNSYREFKVFLFASKWADVELEKQFYLLYSLTDGQERDTRFPGRQVKLSDHWKNHPMMLVESNYSTDCYDYSKVDYTIAKELFINAPLPKDGEWEKFTRDDQSSKIYSPNELLRGLELDMVEKLKLSFETKTGPNGSVTLEYRALDPGCEI